MYRLVRLLGQNSFSEVYLGKHLFDNRLMAIKVLDDERREFGLEISENVELRVHDSTADIRYLVLPLRPSGTEHMSEDQLASLVTRDSMIGTALPSRPLH